MTKEEILHKAKSILKDVASTDYFEVCTRASICPNCGNTILMRRGRGICASNCGFAYNKSIGD